MVVIGIKWPMETFLSRLLNGLADVGFMITLANSDRPDSTFVPSKFRWMKLPKVEERLIFVLIKFLGLFIRAMILFRKDVRKMKKSFEGSSWRENLSEYYRFLPFAGKRWDLIYFPWNATAVSYLPLFNLGMPVIISCRGSQITVAPHNPERQYIRDGLRKTFELAAAVHCVSNATFEEATKYGLEQQKTRIIRPAVDPEFFKPATKESSEDFTIRIISTGSLVWRKGYVDALIAIRKLVDRKLNVHYRVIGDGEDYQLLLYTIEDLELQDRVQLHGKLSSAEVRDKLQEADIFLLTSLTEGISNAVLEGMACGLPVVTTESGGMREAITDGIEGYIVPIMNPDAIADAIEALIRDRDLRIRMGKAGRARILKEFTLKQQVEKFQELCLEVNGEFRGSFDESKSKHRIASL